MSKLQQELDRLGRLPYAIVGAGVSGLYTGWRLRQERPQQAVAIFEQSNRIGGRLLTWLPEGQSGGLRAELGGMRFFKQQQLVWNLVKHLGLEIVDFNVEGPHLIWYLRGYRMPEGDTASAALHYALSQNERGRSADLLIQQVTDVVLSTPENQAVLREHLKKPRPLTRADWDQVKPYLTYAGRPMTDLGYWNVLSDILSYEAYHYITDSFGYYSLTSNWNAAEAMAFLAMDFIDRPVYKTLAKGYSHLPDTLARQFQERGGHLLRNCSLLLVEANQDGSFMLYFKDPDGGEAFTTAERVILAMPRRSLELLQPSGIFNPNQKPLKSLLQTVTPIPAFKLFMLFENRWWESLNGITHGRSVSDLPLRQTYYFRPDAAEKGDPKAPSRGLLMVTYDDAWAVDYWRGMEATQAERAGLQRELEHLLTEMRSAFGGVIGEKAGRPPTELFLAPPAMIARAKGQLALLHGLNVSQIPDPLIGAYADWTIDPYGGGWNLWQPNVEVKEMTQRIRHPVEGRPLYVVGEAYSGLQGWVEGALTSAELVLQNDLKLKRPAWLPADYYLGW